MSAPMLISRGSVGTSCDLRSIRPLGAKPAEDRNLFGVIKTFWMIETLASLAAVHCDRVGADLCCRTARSSFVIGSRDFDLRDQSPAPHRQYSAHRFRICCPMFRQSTLSVFRCLFRLPQPQFESSFCSECIKCHLFCFRYVPRGTCFCFLLSLTLFPVGSCRQCSPGWPSRLPATTEG